MFILRTSIGDTKYCQKKTLQKGQMVTFLKYVANRQGGGGQCIIASAYNSCLVCFTRGMCKSDNLVV